MNKKKIIILISSILILVVILFFLTKYLILVFKADKLNKEFLQCKKKFYEVENYYSAEKCFAKIVDETGKIEYRYFRALALFNLMEFNKAKNELKEIIKNEDKIKNKKLIEKSKNIYAFLNSASEKELIYFIKHNDLELSEENSIRLDIGDYFSDLSKVATWQNPRKITVYIGKSSKKKIIKKAFLIWDEALGTSVHFVFVKDKENADITCFCVKKLDGIKLGSTKTFSKKDVKTKKSYLTKAKMQIALLEPISEKEIDDKNILSTTLHEIGHALGIISHSPQKGDIMYFDSSGYKQEKSEVSNRDVNTVKKIYGNI